ncbi:LamG-like jellyroll fold domain-containing protein [Actinotalea solisilvae]|uniref:LamG-like jellyroll fold domain-containing protein n=1 Tax=Actinotalea solisilvae TaxID=2072922 RepID=UPI0018F26F67|nr:LamG-like jellyroll fold domain-containing protein [Actinotalea solisilvae]
MAATALVWGLVAAPPAVGDTSPTDPARPATVSADPLPTVQINGVVWAQLVVGGTVYVGGNFTRARPAGSPAGSNEVNRTHLLAYDLATGVLVGSFNHTLNGQVEDLAASPDGRTLYVAGQFTTVDGQNRYRVASFDLPGGGLNGTFRPTVNGTITSVGATATSVVIGGNFSAVNGATRQKVAALTPAGANQALSATIPSGSVHALTVAPDGASVVIGGNFTTVNGSSNPGYGLARLALATGANLPLPVNAAARNGGANAAILSLESDGQKFYGAGYVFGSGGNVEGSFAADWATGSLVWIEDCHGDTYAAFPAGQAVYQASHKHYCGNTGSFPQTTPWTFYRGTATTKVATGVNTQDYLGYADHRGRPAPTFLDWYPDINAGTFTGKSQGPWSVAGNDQYVLFGGEFTRVSGANQQGLVRFAVSSIAPDLEGPDLAGASFPLVARSTAEGRVQLTWRANVDRDNARLTYRIHRGTDTSPPIHETTMTTSFWNRHAMSFRDTGLAPGSSQRYRLVASDPFGNVARSDWVTVTVNAGGARSTYAETVLDDAPAAYWRLGEPSGAAVGDATSTYNATAGAGVTRNAAGALVGDADRAATFTGSSTAFAVSSLWGNAPSALSVEAWVRTSTTRGGKIVGFGNATTGTSANADRHLYMDNNGRLYFGMVSSGFHALQSSRTYNDNAWHHVVGTYVSGTMRLYVDGAQVATRSDVPFTRQWWGQWRIGGDRLQGWPGDPTDDTITASIDEVAVYTYPLTAAQVAEHRAAGVAGTPANQAPVASFTTSASGLTAQVDGRGSSDPDGAVTAWAWTFGDGGTGTGSTAGHTYAQAGTYTVGLTVTDDDGATASTTRSVTVTAPPGPGEDLARDAYGRTVSGGWGTADVGGAWSTTGLATQASVDGQRGRHVVAANGTLTSSLAVASTSTDVGVVLDVDRVPDAGYAFVHVQGRRVAATDYYGARLRLAPDGTVQLHVTRGNGSPVAGVVVPNVVIAPGDRLQVRLQVTGTSPTTLRAKAWEVGTAEPAGWQTTATDATASLQAPGGVGLSSFLHGTATNGPLTVGFDDLRAAPVG